MIDEFLCTGDNCQPQIGKNDEFQSGVTGVYWDGVGEKWKAHWSEDSKRKSNTFSVRKYGYEKALEYAIKERKESKNRNAETRKELME